MLPEVGRCCAWHAQINNARLSYCSRIITSSQPAMQTLPPIGELVRRHDPDRFFCSLFAPAGRQGALWALYGFNHELARAQEVAREPAMALIRLHWWREAVEGEPRPHEVATPLAEAIAAGFLPRADLLAMIEAREADIEPAATLPILLGRLAQGPGSLAAAAGSALGAAPDECEVLRRLGAGIGLSGLLRNVAAHARLGLCRIPTDILARHGLTAAAVVADPHACAGARGDLAGEAGRLLGAPQHFRRPVLAAALPAVFARRDLHRPPREHRGLGDKLAVLRAATVRMA
jgi:phytoene synthase